MSDHLSPVLFWTEKSGVERIYRWVLTGFGVIEQILTLYKTLCETFQFPSPLITVEYGVTVEPLESFSIFTFGGSRPPVREALGRCSPLTPEDRVGRRGRPASFDV